MPSNSLLPWFSPLLSTAVSRVIYNLGHRSVLMRGEQIATSAFYNRVVFVKDGFLAQALLNPGSNTPFMLTLSGASTFGYLGHTSTQLDHLPRRYWAVTQCEILTVIPEILIRLSEVESSWSQELNTYGLKRAVSERLGLMVCQAAQPEQRLAAFLVSIFLSSVSNAHKKLESNTSWIALPALPSRKLIATVITCSTNTIDNIIRAWFIRGMIRHKDGAVQVKRQVLFDAWQWLLPFVQMQNDIQAAVRPRNPSAFEI